MKVQYSTRARQSKSHYFSGEYIEMPKIQMEGKWLEALGFHIGDAIQVAYEESSTHISLCIPGTIRTRHGLRYKSRIRIQIIPIQE